jgi:uncharacterized membrane protein
MSGSVPFEVFPIAGGLLVGFLTGWLAPPRLRLPLTGMLSTAIAVAAFVASGEFRVSIGFLIFDLGQAVGSALVTCLLVQLRQRPRKLRLRNLRLPTLL